MQITTILHCHACSVDGACGIHTPDRREAESSIIHGYTRGLKSRLWTGRQEADAHEKDYVSLQWWNMNIRGFYSCANYDCTFELEFGTNAPRAGSVSLAWSGVPRDRSFVG